MDNDSNILDDPLSRKAVALKKATLNNLVETLRPAFELLEVIKGKNVIICFGNTGCGKSTMLNSLIHGSKSLKYMRIEHEVKKENGEIKKIKKGVIGMDPSV